mgnify:CR=1 FL=1
MAEYVAASGGMAALLFRFLMLLRVLLLRILLPEMGEAVEASIAWFVSYAATSVLSHYVHRRYTFGSDAPYMRSLLVAFSVYSITLITSTLPSSSLQTTRAPSGDFAFAAAVAAFGQKLRGDPMLSEFSYPQIAALAGEQTDFWRQEFVQLVKTADGLE